MFNKRKLHLLIIFLSVLLATISCKSNASKTIELPTVLVQLYNSDDGPKLEENFKTYTLKQQKVVSRPMNIFLFTFNSEKIAATELIKELKTSDLVQEAQKNNDVQTRN